MRLPFGVVFWFLAIFPTYAVDYRWAAEVNRGTTEAMIGNANRSSVNIYCSGAGDQSSGMLIQYKKIKPGASEVLDVQMIVDGKNYPFTVTDGTYMAQGRTGFSALVSLASALVASKKKSFAVEFPK